MLLFSPPNSSAGFRNRLKVGREREGEGEEEEKQNGNEMERRERKAPAWPLLKSPTPRPATAFGACMANLRTPVFNK